MQFKFTILLFILLISLSGCELFSTRNPEQPDIGKSNFIPPTEPSTVILNLETAIINKNIDNYMNCFYTFDDLQKSAFQFSASADALAKFPSVFVNWGAEEERRSFTSIVSAIAEGQSPKISWINRKPIQETADSAIFSSDYYLNLPTSDNSIPDEFAGRLQFTITLRDNGLWYISRWIDLNVQAIDTVKNTWSVLKGYYYN